LSVANTFLHARDYKNFMSFLVKDTREHTILKNL
jgi:hypothetical protein